jgi:ribosomal protein S18 acetylase RimI-like enzyme
MPLSVTIRLAHSSEYIEFHKICDNDLPHPLSLEERLVQRRQEFAQIAQGTRVAYFAEIKGEVVGSVQLRLADRTPDEGRVHALVVQRNHRRLGIGSKLMDAVEDEAQRRGYRKVWLTVHSDNDVAKHLYLKRGYTEFTVSHAADGDTLIEMRKQL